jgi:hypothetical protein
MKIMTTQHLVIDFAEARRARGLPSCVMQTARKEPEMKPATATPPPLFDGGVQDLVNKVAEAVLDWNGQQVMSPMELLTLLHSTIHDIAQDPDMMSQTGITRLDRALIARYGDARLGRAALMPPQDILALDGVGQIALDQLISELAKHSALSVPELVCGRGKSGIQFNADIPDGFFELAAGMPGHARMI